MSKETKTKSCTNGPLEKIHWLIHDASYAITQGNPDEAKKLLAEADQMCHEEIGKESKQ